MGREEYFKAWIADKGVPDHFPKGMERLYVRLFSYFDAECRRYTSEFATPAGLPGGHRPADSAYGWLNDELLRILADGIQPLTDIIIHESDVSDYTTVVKAVEANPLVLREWIDVVLSRDYDRASTVADTYGMNTEGLYFLLINWLKPFMVSWRLLTERAIDGKYDPGQCPFCGMYPDIALLSKEKEGKRYLHCTLCEQLWPYPRLKCFHCGNEDQDRLWILSEEGTGRRIDCCEECGAYIKTIIIERSVSMDDIDPVVENAVSGDLDSAALLKGYGRP